MHASSDSSSIPPQTTSNPPPSSCPVTHPAESPSASNSSPSTFSKLNPLNYMPSLSQSRAPNQTRPLPTTREISTIPRGDAPGTWEYPSPQQMYNAMLRKGGDEPPQDAVESMVAVHNFLNEGAWQEIVGWEKRFAAGLGKGWDACLKGEEGFEMEAERIRLAEEGREPKLLRFMGRPGQMTPKARALQMMGWAWPAKYG